MSQSSANYVVGSEEQPNPTDVMDDGTVKTGCSKLCLWANFEGSIMSQGYTRLTVARGSLIMSNVFFSTSLIFLANNDAGCIDEEDEVIDECDARVYGQSPAALIANIAVFSGVLSALLMPLTGAMVDYTRHRRNIGMWVAAFIILIQAAQIGTLPATWFAMAILQGIGGLLYQMQKLATFAYLPEIAREVGATMMVSFQATFTMCQFTAQSLFLIVVIAISSIMDLNAASTAHLSQGISVVWSGLAFYLGWKILPTRPSSHDLPAGKNLITQSFAQVWQTTKHINKFYAHSLRWFLLAVVFAEAAANALTVVSVVFLDEQIGFTTQEIGIFFLFTLVFALPGSRLGTWVTRKTSPTISYQIVMLLLIITGTTGALIMEEGRTFVAYGWGAFIGVELGWYYPVENLAFSILLPEGQEAEIAGFFVYCTQILGWLPPLIFSALVEADIHQKYGIISIQIFFGIAIGIIFLLPKWDDAVAEVVMQDKINAADGEEGAVQKNASPAIRDVVEQTEGLKPSALCGI